MNIGNEISVGNLLTVVAGIATWLMAWQRLKSKSDELERRIERCEERLAEIENTVADEGLILAGIRADVGWIRSTLDQRKT